MPDQARNLDWTVVLLEDELDQREAIVAMLQRLTHWGVQAFDDGDACLKAVEKLHPGAVILDVEIEASEKQGNDVAREILQKRRGGWRPLVVMLTKFSAQQTRDESNPFGDAYIQKKYFFGWEGEDADPDALVCFIDHLYEARMTGNSPEGWPLVYDPRRHSR